MSKATPTTQWLNNIDLTKIFNAIYRITIQPLSEAIMGYKLKVIPLEFCLLIGSVAQLLVILKIDYLLFKIVGLTVLYPVNLYVRIFYLVSIALCGFWVWGLIQVILKLKLTKQLTTVFVDAGLKSASGRLPGFVFDMPIDSEIRHLRLKKNGASMDDWEKAEKKLESDLQIYVDHFKDNIESGTIDIFYAHNTLENNYEYQDWETLDKDSFYLGKSRSRTLTTGFQKCPHYLVAGQTDFGKSHFLNQVITSLYLNNQDYTFELIDLKFGSEFGLLFQNLPRVNVYESSVAAGTVLSKVASKLIEERAIFLKFNECQNINELHTLPKDKIKIPKNSKIKGVFGRKIIVIDEAFELFLKNAHSDSANASAARQNVIKIAAQGRSVGIHVLLGTQRPDAKVIDPLIKANLPGRICFPVPNNPTSMTILDNGRGSQLPQVKGRFIWKTGQEMVEVQAPYLSKQRIKIMLEPFRIQPKTDEKTTENKSNTDKIASSDESKTSSVATQDVSVPNPSEDGSL